MKKIIRLVITSIILISLGLVLEVLLLTILGCLLNLIANGLYIYYLVVPPKKLSQINDHFST